MVKEQKLKAVVDLKKSLETNPVIGIINMHKMPSKQLQEIRKNLRGKATIFMTKKSILQRALEGVERPKVDELGKEMPEQPAIVFTDMDPFKLYGTISKMKSPIAAKEGDIAPREIKVSAGLTNIMAGPAISEFAKAKIPAGVEEGKITVKRDTVVAKKGDIISKDVAGILQKLDIEPMEVSLDVVTLFENGMIYGKDVLSLVGDVFLDKLKEAGRQALNLSVFICYPTKDNIAQLLAKAHSNADALKNKFGGAS